jgi:hypothetical protein
MSVQTATPDRQPDPVVRLFTGGRRLGWTFRDRATLAAAYPEPAPDLGEFRQQAAFRAAAAQQSWARARRWALKPSLAIALIIVVAVLIIRTGGGHVNLVAAAVAIVVLAGPGLAWNAWSGYQMQATRVAVPDREYRRAYDEWQQRAVQYQEAELTRLSQTPEWGSAGPAGLRADVFGGTLSGWRALMAVHGASILGQMPLLVVDLTGQNTTATLDEVGRLVQLPTTAWRLPEDLAKSGLLASLAPGQFASAVAEALHAGQSGSARSDRALDTQILERLAAAISRGGVTPERLAAAARAAFAPGGISGTVLSEEEQSLIAGEMFPETYRQQVGANLVRLEAVLDGLAAGVRPDPWHKPAPPTWYTCFSVSPDARSAADEVLAGLVIGWLTVSVTSARGTTPAVIVAGADEIPRPHLEKLADACERRGVPLTLLFRHLRDDSASMLGGGTAAFMRLGNHSEAEQAASYLGKQHTFAVSTFTATRGGSQTYTTSGSETYGTSRSRGIHHNHGWSEQGLMGNRTVSGGQGRNRSTSTSWSWTDGWSEADGTNWSDATGTQRVYEYRVEPTVLQNLPDCAILLADRSAGQLEIHTVECDPAIVTLPRSTTAPLPPPDGPANDLVPPDEPRPDDRPVDDLPALEQPRPRPATNWWERYDSNHR